MGRGGGSGGGRSGGFSSGGGRGFSSRSSGGSFGGSSGRSSSGRGGGMNGMSRSGGARGGAGMGRTPGYGRGPVPPPPPPRPRRRTIWPVFFPFGRTYYGGAYQTYRSGSDAASTAGNTTQAGGDGTYTPPPYGEPTYGEKRGGIPGWYKFLSVIMLIVAVLLLWNAARASSASKNAGVAREKLDSSACTLSGQWIGDELDGFRDTRTVTDAMQYFYDETGVQPYLLICDNMDGAGGQITDSQAETYLSDLYDSLYGDEGHMIFAFMEYQTSRYLTYVYTGTAADTVMDETARDTFLNIADRYYTDQSLSDEEYFAKIFTEAADTIMADPGAKSRSAMIYALAAVAILVIMTVGLIAFKIQEKKVEEARELRDIIDTPIPKSPEEEELERKYTASDGSGTTTFTKKGEL
ncbi:MAG: hypothetical protein LUE86_07215 [Clostridiales bacterium]|nr:hypothetical protein [Clostridiales bacterium]